MRPSHRQKCEQQSPPLDLITPAEEKRFRRTGYLLLRSVLPPDRTASLLAEVDRLVREANDLGTVLREPYYHEQSYKLVRILRLSDAFDDLIDHPAYFGKLVSLIGPYIQLMGSEIFVRGTSKGTITGFHTDLGAGLQRVLPHGDNAFLQVKMQLFLTDLSKPDSSNFALVPRSHRMPVSDSNELCMVNDLNRLMTADGSLPPGTLQVLARPGDALLFPHSLWHAVAPNRSGRTRYSITLRYGQTALRPIERFDPVLTDPNRTLTLRQRRLLGDFGADDPNPYRPSSQNQIIFGWARTE
ncbi:MAG TPA: phytanoyl-CoA dioxygenase family protein [Thermoanaerobaculia bacterium]|jgi:hypothetical protein|nr:phytanoyl-CoA dioxygenase family protein [Thermoanaerobaculia bacterium]